MELLQLSSQIILYLLVFCRISGFVMACPLTRDWLPRSARILLALGLSVTTLVQLWPDAGHGNDLELSLNLVITACSEFFLGMLLGVVPLLYFSVFSLAGHMTGLQMALGFAELNDPANGVSVTVVAHIYQVMAQFLFVLINGHLLLFTVLLDSFSALPTGQFLSVIDRTAALLAMVGWLFGAGLLIALPAVITLLIVNLTFGFMTRSAPQINLLTLGFPMIILVGIALLSLNIQKLPDTVRQHSQYAIHVLGSLIQGTP